MDPTDPRNLILATHLPEKTTEKTAIKKSTKVGRKGAILYKQIRTKFH